MGKNKIVHELLKRPIAYQPIIAKAFGSVQLAILWSQLYYWSDKGDDPNGWIYKTADELYEETGLKRRGQETARKLGKSLGIIKEKRAGVPATIHFKVDLDETVAVIEKHLKGEASTPKETKKKKTATVTDGALINKIMEAFKDVNPAYERLFAQNPQRQAVDRLTQKFGAEALESMVLFLPKVNADTYSGISITTPYQLEMNLGKLKAWGDKKKNSTSAKGKEVTLA